MTAKTSKQKSAARKTPRKRSKPKAIPIPPRIDVKLLNPLAVMPERAHATDAGFDLTATNRRYASDDETGLYTEYGTGIALAIPEGYVGLVFPRSSVSKTRHTLRNSVGVIDSGYRGEVRLRFSPDDSRTAYDVGDKIGQIIFIKLPSIELMEVEKLGSSSRGTGGFGSTDD